MHNIYKTMPKKNKPKEYDDIYMQNNFERENRQFVDFSRLKENIHNLPNNKANANRKMPNDINFVKTPQLVSPLLTTDIDNYRELLIEDDKKKKKVIPGQLEITDALLFEKKRNELLAKTKLNLQIENEKYQQDLIYLEGQNKLLKEENEHLKKNLFHHEKKSLDEMKHYQDRTVELMQHTNDMKYELLLMKDSQQMNEDALFRNNEGKSQILSLLKSQEMNINILQSNLGGTLSSSSQSALRTILKINQEIFEIEHNLQKNGEI